MSHAPSALATLLLLLVAPVAWAGDGGDTSEPSHDGSAAPHAEGAPSAGAPGPRFIFTYETGPAAILQNDGRYGADGTSYGASDVGQRDNLLRVERASLDIHLGRHTVILLYAPFEVNTRFVAQDELRFRDVTFAPGDVVDHRYLFDGIRASWLYRLLEGPWSFDLGASFQIRNADVAFSAAPGSPEPRYASESDVGLVFALKLRLTHRPERGPWGQLEADALSTFGLFDSFRGGIYDVALTFGVPIARPLDLTFTARLLGGGATVQDRAIENWANFFSASIGLRVDLGAIF